MLSVPQQQHALAVRGMSDSAVQELSTGTDSFPLAALPGVSDQPAYLRVPVYSLSSPDEPLAQSVLLHPLVFAAPHRPDILHSMVVYHRARRRQGTACGKTRGEVNGSTRKVRPQKGSGRSRAGDSRMPHWVGGGRAFPPKPRSFAHSLNKKVRRMGLRVALSAKLATGDLHIVDKLTAPTHKTQEVREYLLKSGLLRPHPTSNDKLATNSLLMTSAEVCTRFSRGTSNLPGVHLVSPNMINVYQLLLHDKFVLTPAIVNMLHRTLLEDGEDDAFAQYLEEEARVLLAGTRYDPDVVVRK